MGLCKLRQNKKLLLKGSMQLIPEKQNITSSCFDSQWQKNLKNYNHKRVAFSGLFGWRV